VGKVFGPVTLLWFLVLGGLGLQMILKYPEVMWSMNPYYAYKFFVLNGYKAFVVMGSVFLVVTGGEALYSDLGHFGKTPIRQAWFVIALPCLTLQYFGQGALLLHEPQAIESPLFLMAPNWALIPLVILATAATIIASQALITGVFSLTMQAVQLQYVPRMTISHTSEHEQGQVYVKTVNFILMMACIALVLMFKTSSNLAAAYGIAVTTTMVITTMLFYYFSVHAWKWNPILAGLLCGFFLIIELAFWGANLLKIVAGGWFPLLVGLVLFMIFTTWSRGRKILSERMISLIMPLEKFLEKVWDQHAFRVPGVAVYMSGHTKYAPATVIQNFQHFQSLHEHVVFLSVNTLDIPHVPKANRIKLQTIGPQIYRLMITFGFMDIQNVTEQLHNIQLDDHTSLTSANATFFLGREHLIATAGNGGMALWREKLFALMSRNAQTAAAFYHLPKERVVEVGSIIEL
jgi:KUP system potassium uptake protein